MSVIFISGKPGGGKSLRGVMEIIDELRYTRRNICTNLALKPGELADYLHREYGETFGLHERLRLLTESEVLTFWLYPALGVDLVGQEKEIQAEKSNRKLKVPDFGGRGGPDDPGTLYVIDEAHVFFSARQWQQHGTAGFYYLSQHRKFRDDVFLVTQYVSNVDKQFRSVAHSYRYIKNRYKQNLPFFGGLFRSVGGFTMSEFPDEYRHGMLSENTQFFSLDVKGIAACYDTTGGVGIVGGRPPEENRRRGLPIWTAAIPLLLIGCLLMYLPRLVGQAAAAATKSVGQGFAGTNGLASRIVPSVPEVTVPPPPSVPVVVTSQEAAPVKSPDRLVGIAPLPGGLLRAWTRDGATFTEGPGVQIIRDATGRVAAVVADGEVIRF